MVYQPDPPFPKTRGNAIRAKDWNDTVNEVVRLDQTKLSSTGGTVAGNLAVTGNLSAGTITGNLAANTVGTSQLADRSVTAPKLADNSIFLNHIAPQSLPPDRLIGFYPQRNLDFTLSPNGRTSVFAGLSNIPACPLVFFVANGIGGVATVEYSVQYIYISGDGGTYQVEFRNIGNGSVAVRVTIFVIYV